MIPALLCLLPGHHLAFSLPGKLRNISLAPANKEMTGVAMGVRQSSCHGRTAPWWTQDLRHKNTI